AWKERGDGCGPECGHCTLFSVWAWFGVSPRYCSDCGHKSCLVTPPLWFQAGSPRGCAGEVGTATRRNCERNCGRAFGCQAVVSLQHYPGFLSADSCPQYA